jgi:membrane-associated phospholipid phosphatase
VIRLRIVQFVVALLFALEFLLPGQLRAQEPECGEQYDRNDAGCPTPVSRSLDAIKSFVAAPLRWDGSQWLLFGGTIAGIGIAHHYDSQVRSDFTNTASTPNSTSSHQFQDAIPAAALLVGTWGYATLSDDADGRRETRTMLEASVFSIGTAYILNFATGRKGPDQTPDPNRWWSGGGSFPSEHTTAAFAIGTVLAESGNDEYRWIRRVLGYGAAGFTAYERLNHNAHWLSDTVAGTRRSLCAVRDASRARRQRPCYLDAANASGSRCHVANLRSNTMSDREFSCLI